jgi:hypothetical protein
MTICPCDKPEEPGLERIAAGLDSLPRQLRAFPEVRRSLLAGIVGKAALANWNARGQRDLGLMWLEMWAYVGDVLGFYDERIANETYVRTAVRRPSLRRIVELLGYVPAPGVAGTVALATLAEGRRMVSLSAGAGFRSNAFGNEPPQVFESDAAEVVEPLANQWEIGPTPRSLLNETLPAGPTTRLIFSPAGFGLAKDRLVLISFRSDPPAPGAAPGKAAQVVDVRPFEGEDGNTYIEVTLRQSVSIPSDTLPSDVIVSTPTIIARVTKGNPANGDFQIENLVGGVTRVHLDARYAQLRQSDSMIVQRSGVSTLAAATVTGISEAAVEVFPGNSDVLTNVTRADFLPQLSSTDFPDQLSFHFAFVDAGQVTLVNKVDLTPADLRTPGGVPITGVVETPPNAVGGELEQDFLIQDKDKKGALVHAKMTFDQGNATFQLLTELDLLPFDSFKTPITVYGNVVEASRGETVTNEVLGNGDPRLLHQQFKLRKKPLTYLAAPGTETGVKSTLVVRVAGVAWTEVKSFFGRGPEDQVYIVRTNDAQETVITFGDGVRGARLPSGVKNVTASYRFGAGRAAPPADSITQLKGQVRDIRSVVSPIAALPGRDPDSPAELRTAAPQSALLFGRLVSVQDFEVMANRYPGVTKAVAEFAWFPDQLQAGVAVHVIADKETDIPALKVGLKEALRAQADPTLPVSVIIAQPLPAGLVLNVEVDRRFELAKVAEAVRVVLLDPETGILAPKNASIGGTFWSSRLYDVVLSVPGVVGVESGIIGTLSGSLPFIELNPNGGFCVPSGAFLDFSDPGNVNINGVEPVGPVPGESATQLGVIP